MTMTSYPIPAVTAVVIHDNKVWLVQRGKEPNKGRWGLPGGKIELGETITEAALRELKEETNITAQAGQILTAFDVIMHDEKQQTQHHYILIPVLCSYLDGIAKAASDAAEVRWFDIDVDGQNSWELGRVKIGVLKGYLEESDKIDGNWIFPWVLTVILINRVPL